MSDDEEDDGWHALPVDANNFESWHGWSDTYDGAGGADWNDWEEDGHDSGRTWQEEPEPHGVLLHADMVGTSQQGATDATRVTAGKGTSHIDMEEHRNERQLRASSYEASYQRSQGMPGSRSLVQPKHAATAVHQGNEAAAQGSRCEECGAPQVDEQLRLSFDALVCRNCKYNPLYSLITKTQAQKEYLLTDKDIGQLRYVSKANPMQKSWTHMRLYLRRQAEALCHAKYGGPDQMAQERDKQLQERLMRREKRKRKERLQSRMEDEVGMDGDGGRKVSSRVAAEVARLEAADSRTQCASHQFAAGICIDEDAGIWSKVCGICGVSVEYEQM